jgi:hypothetical protein
MNITRDRGRFLSIQTVFVNSGFDTAATGDAGGLNRYSDQESCAESSKSKLSKRKEEENTYIYLFTLFTTGVKTPPSRAVHLLLFTINKQKTTIKREE